MPYTLSSVDQSPVCRSRTLPPSAMRMLKSWFRRGLKDYTSQQLDWCKVLCVLGTDWSGWCSGNAQTCNVEVGLLSRQLLAMCISSVVPGRCHYTNLKKAITSFQILIIHEQLPISLYANYITNTHRLVSAPSQELLQQKLAIMHMLASSYLSDISLICAYPHVRTLEWQNVFSRNLILEFH
jgi:hypothetical protein